MTLALCFRDEWTEAIDGCLRRVLAGESTAPVLWALETANVVNLAARRARILPADRRPFLDLFQQLPIDLVPTDRVGALGPVAELAARHALTTYDAAYLAVSLTQDLPIATRDQALRRAAEAAGVALVL